jgi:predicted dehydrogenase
MDSKIKKIPRLAIIGCSWFARAAHIPALLKLSEEGLVEIVALCSRTHNSLEAAKKIIGKDIPVYTNIDILLEEEFVDIVDLVLPTTIIDIFIKKAFKAGKSVISEKPCAASMTKCNSLMHDYSFTDKMLSWSVAENWVYKPMVLKLDQILRSNQLGIIRNIDFDIKMNPKWNGWRYSEEYKGGFLLDSAVHYLSMLRVLTGGVDEVNAKVGWLVPGCGASKVNSSVSYANGAKGRFVVDLTALPDNEVPFHLIIQCDNGVIGANFQSNEIAIISGNQNSLIKVEGDTWVQGGVYEMLRDCLDFTSNVINKKSSPERAIKDVAVIEAMIESSRLNRPVSPLIFYSQIIHKKRNVISNSGVNNFEIDNMSEPSSVQEVQASINEALSSGKKIRPMGIGMNWTNFNNTEGLSMQMYQMDKIFPVDKEKNTIRVQAGVKLNHLNSYLAEHNLSLPSLPFLTNATIGGMISTASHGTSPHWGTMSDQISSMVVVNGRGDVLELSDDSNPELIGAARASLGMLGAVTELELKLVDMKWVRNIKFDIDIYNLIDKWDLIVKKYEHIWAHWLLGTNKIVLQCLETISEPHGDFVPYVTNGVCSWVQEYHHQSINHNIKETIISSQYGNSLSNLLNIINELNLSKFSKLYLGREIELKFCKQSSATLLGPNSNYDAVLFNMYWPMNLEEVPVALGDFEAVMRGFLSRPHWGKYHSNMNLNYLEKSYPDWAAFEKIRKENDPCDLFMLPFVKNRC